MNIKEVSIKFDISTETLRYYERIGLIPKITRDDKGYRNYSEQDQRWVYYAKALRKAGVSIESLIEYVSLVQEDESSRQLRKEILIEQEKKLEEKIEIMQEALGYLRTKIVAYNDYIKSYEKTLELGYKENEEGVVE
ncbi:MerR family transcriptional regulator [Niallia sp. Man26]|uniref:MerR family transcriptional regulator n=1 Tax=Niallia sp. Man26 TaxID=2912824 RepID=UPI001EDB3213|nr:MerR family transcriptional regulator [Niallia sp. Man26]UPO90147.1 MerR family transcriptional regulator [Niallia sp. Man26]